MERGMSRAELRAEYRRRVFQVFNGDEWMCSYGDVNFMQPQAPSPTRDYTLQDVIADLVKDFDEPEGTDARDMAVWRAAASWPSSGGAAMATPRSPSSPRTIDFPGAS